MTRDEILHLAEQAGCGWARNGTEPVLIHMEKIVAFAALVAAAERDALRAKIEAMEKQEPVGKFTQHPSNGLWEQDGYGDNPEASPLYALPGAKGEEK